MTVFSTTGNYALSAGLWASVALGFSRFGRHRSVRTLVWLSPVVIVCVTLVVNVLLRLAGIVLRLEVI